MYAQETRLVEAHANGVPSDSLRGLIVGQKSVKSVSFVIR